MSSRRLPRRFLPWACTVAVLGAAALTLPSSVLADPGPDPAPAESAPGRPASGGARSGGWEDTKPSDSRPWDSRPPGAGSPGTRHPYGAGASPSGTPTPGSRDTGTPDSGTADTWIPDTGEGGLGRITEGVDGDDPDGPDGMPDGTGSVGAAGGTEGTGGTGGTRGTGGADEPSDTGPVGSAAGRSPGASPVALLRKLKGLYRQSEESARAYRATEDDLRAARRQSGLLSAQLTRARAQLEGGRADAGRLARLQYQRAASPVSSYLRVLLARNPQQAMDTRHLIREAARDQRAAVARFTSSERKADKLATEARVALDRQQALADRARYQRETAAGKLKEVEALLASLSPEQLAELGRMEAQATDGMRVRRDLPAEA
ncbi:hypothetical protein [Streptomyces chattanoogensis]|uniref:hypothetical protein n=1 Tax=Streptomyces chattanoogensis TaxID=66876 RepID=UPI000B22BF17|nr:hypothetical protein [Streptomyces chattanoogensis]